MLNPYKDIHWSPDLKERRAFARSLVIGFPCVAALLLAGGRLVAGAWNFAPALYIGGIGTGLGLLLLALPAIARPFYIVWYGLACAIGLVVGNVLLTMVYLVFVTGTGQLLRLSGRRPIRKQVDRERATYWLDAGPPPEPRRYFRQF